MGRRMCHGLWPVDVSRDVLEEPLLTCGRINNYRLTTCLRAQGCRSSLYQIWASDRAKSSSLLPLMFLCCLVGQLECLVCVFMHL